MYILNRLILLLTALGVSILPAQTPADLMNQFHKAQDNLSTILENINDAKTAQAKLPAVIGAIGDINNAKAKLKQLTLDKNNAQHADQVKGNEKQAQQSTTRLVNQLNRISHNGELDKVLHGMLSKL
jgi:hypothetical protein